MVVNVIFSAGFSHSVGSPLYPTIGVPSRRRDFLTHREVFCWQKNFDDSWDVVRTSYEGGMLDAGGALQTGSRFGNGMEIVMGVGRNINRSPTSI